jgi:hypothetical protein
LPALVVCLGGGQELTEHGLITLPFLLQPLDPHVEPRQSDVVVKIEGISDLFVDTLACRGDLFIAHLAGVRNPLPQVVNFRGILRPLGGGQEQPAGIRRLLNRTDIGLGERDVGGKIVVVDDDELIINSTGHAHAQESDDGHQNQKPDGDAEYFDTNGNAHGRIIQSAQPGPSYHAGRPQSPNYIRAAYRANMSCVA